MLRDGVKKGDWPIRIRITSLKMLHHLLRQGRVDEAGSCAIIVAEETPLRPELMGRLRYVHVPFPDANGGPGSMQPSMAGRIAAYFMEECLACRQIYVCCDAGESRSAAIAAALMRCANGTCAMQIWQSPKYHPNPHVYRTMCSALGIETDDAELHMLEELNRNAFDAALRKARRR